MERADILEFERLTYSQQHEQAAQLLLRIVDDIGKTYGQFAGHELIGEDGNYSFTEEGLSDLTRLAGAISALFCNPNFKISDTGYNRIVTLNRWISAIFYATPFKNTDHILRVISEGGKNFSGQALVKFCALYSQESLLSLPIDDLYDINPLLAISLGLSLVASRQLISKTSHQKREALLQWLPEKIEKLESLDGLPVATIHDAMMHCSYADLKSKHQIKLALNDVIRKDMLKHGLRDVSLHKVKREKPVLLVVLDWWRIEHAMYRCYVKHLEGCKDRFKLVALVTYQEAVDEVALSIFDDRLVMDITKGIYPGIQDALKAIEALAPDLVYHPAIGMGLPGIFLSNLRMAPIQLATLGHPATTASRYIDYVVSADDFHGSSEVFYEKVVLLPRDSHAFLPPLNAKKVEGVSVADADDEIRVAITASLMKVNPIFLQTCKRIQDSSRKKVKFHFYLGFGVGIAYLNAKRSITEVLPEANVYPSRTYDAYISSLSVCHIFLSPFPFGNTNGIVDCVRLGMPGVCLHGDEPHSAIDRGMFHISGIPDYLVAEDHQNYINAAVTLIDDDVGRSELRRSLLLTGEENLLGDENCRQFGVLLSSLKTVVGPTSPQ